jgi:hypothetical protein
VEAWSLVGVDPFWGDDVGCSVPSELDLPAVGGGVVAGFDDGVVVVAEEGEVRQGCLAAGPPGHAVVGVAGGWWFVAAGEDAAAVAEFEGCPDGGGDEALGTSDIQDF